MVGFPESSFLLHRDRLLRLKLLRNQFRQSLFQFS